MMEIAALHEGQDRLFLGLTRPATIGGVSYEAVVFGVLFTMLVFLAAGNPLYMLSYAPIHAVCYLICLRDPRAFRLIMLWMQTKCKAASARQRWKASSVSPFYNTRRNRQNAKGRK